MTIFGGKYFEKNPSKVLGEIFTHNPNTGKLLTDQFGNPRPEVRGDIDSAMNQLSVPDVKRFDHYNPQKQVSKVSTQAKIAQVVEKTKQDAQDKASAGHSCNAELQCLDETIAAYNPNISKEEMEVWVTYQTQTGLYDLETIQNNDWGTYYVEKPNYPEWHQAGLVAFDGEKYVPQMIYYSGNIYAKIDTAKQNKQAIASAIGVAGYEKQMELLTQRIPTPLLITDNESNKLYLSPFDRIWDDIEIGELADGVTFDAGQEIGSIFYRYYTSVFSTIPSVGE